MAVILQQQQAADPAHSVWMSANAGTGKTKVLTDRVLRLLLQGTFPDRILCLTYTKAAAAEMANRIHKILRQWTVAEETELRQKLGELTGLVPDDTLLADARSLFARVVDAPEGIRILTIHSLCQSLLRRFSVEAGISPYFRVMEEHETKLLLAEAKRRMLATALPEGIDERQLQEVITRMAGRMSESSIDELIESIINQRSDFQQALTPAGGRDLTIKTLRRLLGISVESETEEALVRGYFSHSQQQREALQRLLPTIRETSGKANVDTAEELGRFLAAYPWSKPEQVEGWVQRCLTQKNVPRKNIVTNAVFKRLPEAEALLAQEQQRCEAYRQAQLALGTLRQTEDLLTLAEALLSVYNTLKRQQGLLDFDDLIQHAEQLLQQPGIAPWVLYKLDGGIDHLLVDEAQDTSYTQWRLIEALVSDFFSGETARNLSRTLFVVGDEKQSIYSFQGAEPKAFAEMKQHFATRIKAAEQKIASVALSLSFRSTPAVLKLVDTVFADATSREGVCFTDDSAPSHQAHRNVPGRVELWPVVTQPEVEEREPWTIPQQRVASQQPEEILAENIADRIGQWLQNKRYLPAKGRAVQPGDIMILVRRRNRFFEALIRSLKQRDIPLAGADRMKLTEHIAVQDMLAMAQFLLLPEDDLTLACLLKSPLFGISEETLFTLCYGRGEATLWQILKKQSEPALQVITRQLHNLLDKLDYIRPYELFAQILEVEGGRQKFIARMGAEVEDPLNEFLALALHYESLHSPTLLGFLHWFRQSDTEIKRDMEQADQQVRILTVHGSKGLQAPIVFLPDTTGVPRNKERIFWRDGIPLWSYDASQDSTPVTRAKDIRKEAELQEYRRLLYVALTRAEDELYISGWLREKNLPDHCWYCSVSHAMQQVGEEAEPDHWVLQDAVEDMDSPSSPASEATEKTAGVHGHLPECFSHPAPEAVISAPPLMPSRPDIAEPLADSPTAGHDAALRGKVIHQLLEVLPDTPTTLQEHAAAIMLQYLLPEWEPEGRNALWQQVRAILQHPDYAPLFGPDSQAEVPVTAHLQEEGASRLLSGRIDRLVVLPERVLIIDYKTNLKIPASEQEIPAAFRQQLVHYRKALAPLYPDHQLETLILWTAGPAVMAVSDSVSQAA